MAQALLRLDAAEVATLNDADAAAGLLLAKPLEACATQVGLGQRALAGRGSSGLARGPHCLARLAGSAQAEALPRVT